MAQKRKKLRGCSAVVMPDGTVHEVRDLDGNLVIDPQLWEECKQRIAERLSRHFSERLAQHPEIAPMLGFEPGQTSGTVNLMDFLRYGEDKEKTAPDGNR